MNRRCSPRQPFALTHSLLAALTLFAGLAGCDGGDSSSSGGGGSAGAGANGGANPAGGEAGAGANGSAGSGAATNTGSGGSGTSSGSGAADTGGSGGGGSNAGPTPNPLSCGALNVAAADVISDFSTEKALMYKVGERGGTEWYAYSDNPASSNPSSPGNAFAIDEGTSGPCNSGGALKVSSPGNTGYGVGFGVNLMSEPMGSPKLTYDAKSQGYTGVGFWMKCDKEVEFVLFKTPDSVSDPDLPGSQCNYDGSGGKKRCNHFGIKNVAVQAAWQYYDMYFDEMLQDPAVEDPLVPASGKVDAAALASFQVQINTRKDQNGQNPVANGFTCWIDDVHFLKGKAPEPPAGTGFTVNGNKIKNAQNQDVVFRGIARPSLEWDESGWNLTRWDLHRIATEWKANVVRFSLNQALWLGHAGSGKNGGKPFYKDIVDRAVRWALAEGMTVILDLHWSTAGTTNGAWADQHRMPDQYSTQFWQEVAAKYAGDTRVLFELYNEPYPEGENFSVWKNGGQINNDPGNQNKHPGQSYQSPGMQGLYQAVRNTGAQNVVLIGGVDWAFNLSGVQQNPINGNNIVYVTHPYDFKPNGQQSSTWDQKFGFLTSSSPVMATEFGTNQGGCNAGFYTSLIDYMKTKGMSWTAWAWYVDAAKGCTFPTLITDYAGTPNAAGTAVKNALQQ